MIKALGILGGLAVLALFRAARAISRPRSPGSPEKLLVLGYGAVGDLLFFLPTLRALRRLRPKSKIIFIANKYPTTKELLPAAGLTDEIWLVEATNWTRSYRREVLRQICREGFDAVVMSLSVPARYFAPALLDIPVRVGHCRPIVAPHAGWSKLRYFAWRVKRGLISEEFERRLVLNRKVWVREDQEHMVVRNLRLVEALGLVLSSADSAPPNIPEPASARVFAEAALPAVTGRETIGLHLGSSASQYAKIWPPERWAAVCRRLDQAAPARFVLVGGLEEKDSVRRFGAVFGSDFVDFVGSCGLLETFAVIRRCSRFLSNDTGLAKAAMALGVPTATVWGPSDRSGWGVFWEPMRHLEVFRPVVCAPCVRMGLRNEGFEVINHANCGHHACLRELQPDDVAEAIGRWRSA